MINVVLHACRDKSIYKFPAYSMMRPISVTILGYSCRNGVSGCLGYRVIECMMSLARLGDELGGWAHQATNHKHKYPMASRYITNTLVLSI